MNEITAAPVAMSLIVDADTCVVVLSGELDVACSAAVGAGLANVPAECGRIILDLSRVSFIDCSGLQILETALDRMGRDVVVREPSRSVRWMLELLGPTVLGPWADVVTNEARSA
jgi:anti-anti-sigma factor